VQCFWARETPGPSENSRGLKILDKEGKVPVGIAYSSKRVTLRSRLEQGGAEYDNCDPRKIERGRKKSVEHHQ